MRFHDAKRLLEFAPKHPCCDDNSSVPLDRKRPDARRRARREAANTVRAAQDSLLIGNSNG